MTIQRANTIGSDDGRGSAAVDTAPQSALRARRPPMRLIMGSVIGTTIEFNDFFVYATAAVIVFPALFFPSADPTTSILASFAAFGAAFVARPIGGMLFGYLGDRIGRTRVLVYTLMTMGLATVVIGLLPAATSPGWQLLAPTLLVAMRLIQGLGLGGEWSGAALLATENAPRGRTAFYGSLTQLGAALGFGIATATFLVLSTQLSHADFFAWGWRIPFLMSAVLVFVGLWVRVSLQETPVFEEVIASHQVDRAPLRDALKDWRQLLRGTGLAVSTFALFYLLTTFSLTFATTPADAAAAQAAATAAGTTFDPAAFAPGLGYSRPEVLIALLVGVGFLTITTLLSGPATVRFGRKRYLTAVNISIMIFGLASVPLLSFGTGGALAVLFIGFLLIGAAFGPMAAVITEMFPARIRFTGSALAYNAAGILGAAIAPYVAVSLWHTGGDGVLWVGVYLTALAGVSLISVRAGGELDARP